MYFQHDEEDSTAVVDEAIEQALLNPEDAAVSEDQREEDQEQGGQMEADLAVSHPASFVTVQSVPAAGVPEEVEEPGDEQNQDSDPSASR